MVYLIMILSIFAVIIMVRNYANKFSIGFASMIVGLILSLLGTVLFVSSIGYYPSPNIWIFFFDYKLYTLLTSFNLGYYNTINLINLGISIFLFAMPITVYLWIVPLYYVKKRQLITRLTLWGIFAVYYYWFYKPSTVYNIYIMLKDATYPQWAKVIAKAVIALSYVNRGFIMVVLMASIICLIVFYFRTHMKMKKRQTLSMIFCITFLNVFWAIFFFFGFAGKTIGSAYSSIDSLYFSDYTELSMNMYIVYPIIMLFGTILMLFLVIKNKTFDTIDFFTEYNIRRKMNTANNDIRNIFHTIKNTLFAMNVLAQNGMATTEDEQARKTFDKINNLSKNTLSRVENMLVSTKNVSISTETVNFIDVLEDAISRSNIDPTIEVVRDYRLNKIMATIDTYHLPEALINIINNASEAIVLAKKEAGRIKIEVYMDYDWLVVNIKDNGTGISAKNIKDIFKPFYSTKAPGESWGVGLTYSYNVIKAHSGFLIAKSQENAYTLMQCLIPVKKGGYRYE